MSDPVQLLKQAGVHYLFHASRATNMRGIADYGCLASSKIRNHNSPGAKKDIRLGGGAYVYCRYVHDRCSTTFNQFGTRSSLTNNVHFVVPVEKLENYSWFISSVDMNGKLPGGVDIASGDMDDRKKQAVIAALKRYPNDKNGEIGIFETIQLDDISHIVISKRNFSTLKRDYFYLVQNINLMKDNDRVKVIVGDNYQQASIRLANANSFIQ